MEATLARIPRPGDPVLFLDVDGVISVFGLGRSSRHVHGWALARQATTLLVDTRCDVGLTDEHVDLLLEWADEVAPCSCIGPESFAAV